MIIDRCLIDRGCIFTNERSANMHCERLHGDMCLCDQCFDSAIQNVSADNHSIYTTTGLQTVATAAEMNKPKFVVLPRTSRLDCAALLLP